jgi:hypothetical protein
MDDRRTEHEDPMLSLPPSMQMARGTQRRANGPRGFGWHLQR